MMTAQAIYKRNNRPDRKYPMFRDGAGIEMLDGSTVNRKGETRTYHITDYPGRAERRRLIRKAKAVPRG